MVKPKQNKRSSLSRFICRLVTFRWFNRKSKEDFEVGHDNDPIRQGQGDLVPEVLQIKDEVLENMERKETGKISCKSQDEIFYQPVIKRKEYFEKCFPSVPKQKETQEKAQSLQNVAEIKEEEIKETCEEDSQVSFSAPNLSKETQNPLPSTSKVHEIYNAESVTPYESQVFEIDSQIKEQIDAHNSKIEEHNLFIHSSMIIDGIQKISTFSEEDVVSSNWYKDRSLVSIEESMVANCCSGPNSVKTEDLEFENAVSNRIVEEDYYESDCEELEYEQTNFKQDLAFGDSIQNEENSDNGDYLDYEDFQNISPEENCEKLPEPIFAFDEPEQSEVFEPQIEIRVYDRIESFEQSGDGLHYDFQDGYLDLPCEQERGDYDDVEQYFVYDMSEYDRPNVVIPPEIFCPNGINFGYDCISTVPIAVEETISEYQESSYEVIQDVIQEILDKMLDELAQNPENEFSYIGTTEEEENRFEYENHFPDNENRLDFDTRPEFSSKTENEKIEEEEPKKKTRKRRNRRKKKTENCDENSENVFSQRKNSPSESSSTDKLSVGSATSTKVEESPSFCDQPADQPSKKKRKRGKRK